MSDRQFAFGKNWADYAPLIDDERIIEAENGLLKLIPEHELKGRSFLDIGCGSGLHALAAARLGVARIFAIDFDPDSVTTARALLSSKKLNTPWHVEVASVFDLDPDRHGKFDVVYSWGVLHFTGSMWAAVRKAAFMVAPNGLLAIALYRRTRLDPLWKIEKRLYAHAPKRAQDVIRATYVTAFRLAKLATGKNYNPPRGMNFYHDVHDWLGGYPYETALSPEVDDALARLGFRAERVFARPMSVGIFGSGCDEYVYRLQ